MPRLDSSFVRFLTIQTPMKPFSLIVLSGSLTLAPLFAEAQGASRQTIPYEDLGKVSLGDARIEQLAKQSKEHVLKSAENQIKDSELELLDVEVVLETVPAKADVAPSPSPAPMGQTHCATCHLPSGTADPLPKSTTPLVSTSPKKKHFIYITWGYNRGFHSNSDATFKTASGTFTIHDAVGHDRQSTELLDYIHPERIPIPQYNLKIGYEVNENWDIVAGLDHMKWVFQNDRKYEISGDYNRTVFVPHSSGDPGQLTGLNFDQVKATGDARWLNFEHTDGFNYAHLGAVYKKELWRSKNERFSLGVGGGAGAGLMVPQTTVKFHQDNPSNWQGVDNKFHLAGYGGHADAHLRLGIGNFFMQPTVRGTYIKMENALVNSAGDRLEQTPIGSIQFIVEGGYKIPIGQRKKKKHP
jgi:hypothetical protein